MLFHQYSMPAIINAIDANSTHCYFKLVGVYHQVASVLLYYSSVVKIACYNAILTTWALFPIYQLADRERGPNSKSACYYHRRETKIAK